MSDDYLKRLERHLGAYREDDDSEVIDGAAAYRWLTVGDQRSAVAEVKRLRERADKAEADAAETRAYMADPFNRHRIAEAVKRAHRQRDEAVEEANAEVEEYRDDLKATHEELARVRAELAERVAAGGEPDLSGWSAAENAEFEKLYGVQAAMRLRAAHDRVWAIVQELRSEAVKAGRDPYQDPMAQRLSAALVGAAGAQRDDAAGERPHNSAGLIDTLLRVSGLTADELGRLFAVSGNAINLWRMGGRMNQAHYERAVDLNGRMQKLPSKTFYGRREALFATGDGRSVYDQMLAEEQVEVLEPNGSVAYFEAGEEA